MKLYLKPFKQLLTGLTLGDLRTNHPRKVKKSIRAAYAMPNIVQDSKYSQILFPKNNILTALI